MLKATLLLFLFYFSIPPLPHDFKIATFNLFQEGGDYYLAASFDKEDLLTCLKLNAPQIADWEEETIQTQTQQYLLEKLILSFNDEHVNFQFNEMIIEPLFIRIQLELHSEATEVNHIKIINQCLIDNIEDHSNLMKVNLHNKKRIFRLNAQRQETEVVY